MIAYHFLKVDMTTGSGDEPPWSIGEKRTFPGKIVICESGYHTSPSFYDALPYAPGPLACITEISKPVEQYGDKQVSRCRRFVAARNVERELGYWACDCAERALLAERENGREPDSASWNAVATKRRFLDGMATTEDLAAAASAASAAWSAAGDAVTRATITGRSAPWSAATSAAWSAAWSTSSAAGSAVKAASAAWTMARSAAASAAASAGWSAAGSAVSAGWSAVAWITAQSAAASAAASAAEDAEKRWQRQALQARLDAVFAEEPV